MLIVMMLFTACGANAPVVTHEREAYGKNGMVASANKEASQIGIDILKSGGNAVDAAVAVGFALGVLEPNASGVGGGGFMLLKMAGEDESKFIDFREVTPISGSIDKYTLDDEGNVLGSENQIGPKSIAIPGEVKGLLTALENFGTLDRETIIRPSVNLSKDGVVVSKKLAEISQSKFDLISKYDESAKIFTNEGFPLMEGDIIKNDELANTLEMIIDEGSKGFYNSDFTVDMVSKLNDLGAYIKIEDFNNYEVSMLEAVSGNYRGYEIISSPPPSSGGTHVIEILNMVENYDLAAMEADSADTLHLWAEIYKMAYQDRNAYMGDINFNDVPIEGLLSKEYASERVKGIDMTKSSNDEKLVNPWPYESGSTTHYSIVDKDGNMVSVTKTINHFFGSGVTVNGILMNDEIADLSFEAGSPNIIEPGKKPLSSMSPTFILKDGKAYATLGTPGGKRIITTIPWIVSMMIDHGMNLQEAIDAPRLNNYENGQLKLEDRFSDNVYTALESKGHDLNIKKEYDLYFGGAQGVMIREDGYMHGAADLRRDGYAIGY